MQLSQETYRTRWIVLVSVWALAAVALFSQARVIRDYLSIVGQLGLRGAPTAGTPLTQAFPAFAVDAQVWVRHSIALLEGDKLQLRHTPIDNAPKGREVHWNSAWAWTIAGAGKIYQLFTGLPLATSVERATIWLNPSVMLCIIIALSTWATRRAGLIAGVFVVAAMTGHDRIYEGFFPSYVDHHGLLTVSVLGMLLGAIFMGGGWWQQGTGSLQLLLPESPAKARSAAVFSALCGACGLWVSAASIIPPIAIVGAAGLFTGLILGPSTRTAGANFDPNIWRLWGRVGAAASVFFYLVEYFPSHMTMRLEPNHPFHALAWLGGGELIGQLIERRLQPASERYAGLARLIWPVIVVLVAPTAIAVGHEKVFVVLDPFMSRLHNDYIQEFLPLWRTLRNFDASGTFQIIVVGSLPLILGIATLTYRGRESPVMLWFTTFATFIFTVMAWGQSRWLLNATGAHICLVLVLVATWTAKARPFVRWAVMMAVVGTIFIPSAVKRYVGSSADLAAKRVAPKDAFSALNRDIARALRATQPEGEITLLASPNASTGIAYYGWFKTLGTLYWENSEGLKAAASTFGARTEAEAAKLIRELGVTHIAIISDENFIDQYFHLIHPEANPAEARKCFGNMLLIDRTVPQWLQVIPYKLPDDLSALKSTVLLFKVNFAQSLSDAIYSVVLSQIEAGALDEADRTLDLLITHAPQAYQPWLRKGEIQFARKNYDAALQFLEKGIQLSPAPDRINLYISSAGGFYKEQKHDSAIRLYRAALAEKYDPTIAIYLSWILATSQFDALRNGKEALELAENALMADPNSPSLLNGVAAALAELGRFSDAVAIEDRALANAKLRAEIPLVRDSEERLNLFRANKPLRR